jgi:diaminohydroxyphosphoribosylaminopyrimidine deaminase / 5-amino-6-(5-phosphoribosylamino)uracil reductase
VGNDDERHMRRAIALARSAPHCAPNPRVGAVVVRDGAIVSEGVHRGPGTAHAEAAALAEGPAGDATLYVNLEPCVHHGRTPPCAQALVGAGIRRVVIAIEDPDARVAGRGIELLRAAGVEVTTGVLAQQAQRLNAGYLEHRATGRPLVSLKLALTLDGHMAAADGSARWITGARTRRRVHVRRSEVDAVMVGAGTVATDDPRLTARHIAGARQPARIVVDSSGRTSPEAAVLAGGGEAIVATTRLVPHEVKVAWKEAGAQVLELPGTERGVDLAALLEHLGAQGMVEVMCEGGARLASSLLSAGLVGRLELHYGPVIVGGGPAVAGVGVATLADAARWRPTSVARSGDDALVVLEQGA